MPLSDVFGKTGTAPPVHNDEEVPKLNVGTILGLTVTVNVVGDVQPPTVGVNV